MVFNCPALKVVSVVSTSNLTLINHNGYCITSIDPAFGNLVIDGQTIDGIGSNLGIGTWVLLTGQTNAAQNGLFQVTQVANVANQTNWQICRVHPGGCISVGMLFYVKIGYTYYQTLWCLTIAQENYVDVAVVTPGVSYLTIDNVCVKCLEQ